MLSPDQPIPEPAKTIADVVDSMRRMDGFPLPMQGRKDVGSARVEAEQTFREGVLGTLQDLSDRIAVLEKAKLP